MGKMTVYHGGYIEIPQPKIIEGDMQKILARGFIVL